MELTIEYVQEMPKDDDMQDGILYISKQFNTSIHLCACGCGMKTVTPQSLWSLSENNGRVTLSPSIGNYSFDCKSHYWVKDNKVVWA